MVPPALHVVGALVTQPGACFLQSKTRNDGKQQSGRASNEEGRTPPKSIGDKAAQRKAKESAKGYAQGPCR